MCGVVDVSRREPVKSRAALDAQVERAFGGKSQKSEAERWDE